MRQVFARVMIRISTIFVAICMVLVAASLGMILYALLGINAPNSAIVALAALTFLILFNAVSTRLRDRDDTSGQITDLSRGTADLARQVAEFGRRLAVVETRVASSYSVSQDRIQSVHTEIGELGALVKQLAGSVASHDDALSSGWAATAPSLTPPPSLSPQPQFSHQPQPSSEPSASRPDTPLLTAIRHAIEANRIDIYLQPMVTLPQRKVRFYEAVSRLRGDDDQVLSAGEFIGSAEAAGLMGQIDHAVMLRCMQVLRRLMVRNKDVGVFCNMAAATLGSADSFEPCLDFLEANRALAASFVIEFKQSTFRSLGAVENEHLAALAQRGFRFSIDNVTDLRIDPRDLAERGVRYVKVQAKMLLDQRRTATADIATADLSDLLGRFGIDLIAERIEGERDVVDLLDYDVRFGQGFLFAAPRPLRPEAVSATQLSASPEPAREAVTQESNTLASPPAPPPRPEVGRIEPPRLTGNAALARRALGPN